MGPNSSDSAAFSREIETADCSGLLVWITFVLICFGLGYPTLNRYDPRQHLPDAAVYAQLAREGPQSVSNHFRFRVLVPYLARQIFLVVKGHTGSWDPLLLGFLVVNSLFVASAAYLTSVLGTALLGNRSTALLGAALYLLNFAIANAHLAGLVDAGEAFFLLALVASMFYAQWTLLPLIGVLGALTKESFVPFSILMAGSWWLWSRDKQPWRVRRAILIASMFVAEFAVIIVLQSLISGSLVWPWDFLSNLSSQSSYLSNFAHSLVDRSSWYILIWIVPLGLVRIGGFPRPWVAASSVASLSALVLNAYHSTVGGGGGGMGRYIFDVAGPLLSLAVAACLTGYGGHKDSVVVGG